MNTEGTELVDIHTIRLARPGYTVMDLDASIGTVHHYRALAHHSVVLAQSGRLNSISRDTHLYMKEAKMALGEKICSKNNPNIGDIKYAD